MRSTGGNGTEELDLRDVEADGSVVDPKQRACYGVVRKDRGEKRICACNGSGGGGDVRCFSQPRFRLSIDLLDVVV